MALKPYRINAGPALGPAQPTLVDRAKNEALKQGANYALNAALPGGGVLASGVRNVLGFEEGGKVMINPKNEGKFTAKANAAGEGVQEYASKVLAAPEGRYDPATRKQANFAKNAAQWHNDGGYAYNPVNDPSRQIGDALAASGGALAMFANKGAPVRQIPLGAGYDPAQLREAMRIGAITPQEYKAAVGFGKYKNEGGEVEKEPKWYDLVGHFEKRNKTLTGKDKEDRKSSYRNEGGPMGGMEEHIAHAKRNNVKVGPLSKAVYKNEGGAVREMHYHNPMMAQNKPSEEK